MHDCCSETPNYSQVNAVHCFSNTVSHLFLNSFVSCVVARRCEFSEK